ncbi:trypsin-like serine peptidase [Streptosporangium sp. NPDC003464]
MKRILLPAGGAVLATGLLAAGLAGTANANPDWAYDTMAKDAPSAVAVAKFWLAANNHTNNLAKATPYTWETKATPTLNAGGGYTPDGKPGTIAPIGEEKKSTSVVKNINLPRTIGKVFFVDAEGDLKWCSATSIQSKYRNLVATAGSCVYDDKKNASVMDNWAFVPAYYQGKAPFGVFVGKQAYTHYDYTMFNDRDKDYAFVTVYNGVQVGGGTPKQVTKADFDKYTGAKVVDEKSISEAEYKAGLEKYGQDGPFKSAAVDPKVETVAKPADAAANIEKYIAEGKDGVKLVGAEVVKSAYDAAPSGLENGNKFERLSNLVNISLEEYNELKAKKASGGFLGNLEEVKDAKGNVIGWTKQQFYVKKWVKTTTATRYWVETYYVIDGFIKDTGRLGEAVGGQGFTWNQKTGQTVYIFGYPADAHPDGNKAYTGTTPKWCYGKTTGKVYVSAAEKVEEHVGLKCAMTPGANGSPWLVKYSSAKRLGYVNGVTSLFGDQDKNGRYDLSTSAYFDGETAMIYNKAANVWSGSIVK